MGVEYEGDLTPELVDYIKNHLEKTRCRVCQNHMELTYVEREIDANIAKGKLYCGHCDANYPAVIGLRFE